MARRTYADEQKAAVLARAEEIGIVAASNEAGIDRKTVSNWLKAAKTQETSSKGTDEVQAVTAEEADVKQAKPRKKPTKAERAGKKTAKVKPAQKTGNVKTETRSAGTDQKERVEKKINEKKTISPGMKPEWFEKMKNSKPKDEFKDNMKSFWEKKTEMEKSSVEAAKKQWSQSFDYLKDMQERFIDSLPDDAKFPVPLKSFMNEMKKFQEMSKAHFEEQADSAVDFYFKGQERFFDMICAAMGKKEK